MSYKEIFLSQWDKLNEDFNSEAEEMQPDELTHEDVSEWYTTHSFRWSSMVEPEGRFVGEIENSDLRTELLEAVADFHFKEDNSVKKPAIAFHLIISFLLAVASVFIVLFFFKPSLVRIFILFMAFMSGGFLSYAVRLDRYNKKAQKGLVESYSRQLSNYKGTFEKIFEKYPEQDAD